MKKHDDWVSLIKKIKFKLGALHFMKFQANKLILNTIKYKYVSIRPLFKVFMWGCLTCAKYTFKDKARNECTIS